MAQKEYRGFIISWREPPEVATRWDFNVASNNPQLQSKIGSSAYAMAVRSRDVGFAEAQEYIDNLLDG